jgi:NADPH:quinone reductase
VRALVCVGPPELVAMRDVPDPDVEPGQALVQVEAVSVNRGELNRLNEATTAGWRPGWDFSGRVLRGAADGVKEGDRVFGMLVEGSWAELVAAPVGQLAAVPDDVPWEVAAALPVAGLTAMRTLRLGGDLSGRSVLVAGAAGGVGRIAVQLAHQAGAHVTAVVGRPERAAGMRELGADEVALELPGLERRYDLVLESAGGEALRDAIGLLAAGGLLVTFGNSSRARTTFLVNDFYAKQASIRGFFLLTDLVAEPPAADLARLVELYRTGRLRVEVPVVASWTDARAVLEDLRARRLAGKAVLRISSADQGQGS